MSFNFNLSDDDDSEGEDEADFNRWLSSNAAATQQNQTNNNNDQTTMDNDGKKVVAAAAFLPSSGEEEDDDDEEEEVDWEDAAFASSGDQKPVAKTTLNDEDTNDKTSLRQTSPSASATTTTLQPVTIDFSKPKQQQQQQVEEETKKKRKRQRRRQVFRLESLPDHLQTLVWNLHRTHLLALISRGVALSQRASDPELLAVAHSLIQQQEQLLQDNNTLPPTLGQLRHFLTWFGDAVLQVQQRRNRQAHANRRAGAPAAANRRRQPRRSSSSRRGQEQQQKLGPTAAVVASAGRCGIPTRTHLLQYADYLSPTYNDDPQLAPACEYSRIDTLVLFVAMARSLGWRTRWVQAVDAVPLDLTVAHPLLATTTACVFSAAARTLPAQVASGNTARKKAKKSSSNGKEGAAGSLNNHEDINAETAAVVADQAASELCWLEVWCRDSSSSASSSKRRWIHVDPIHQVFNQPDKVEVLWTKQQQHPSTATTGRASSRSPRGGGSKTCTLAYVVAVEHAASVNADEESSLRMETGSTPLLPMRLTDVTPRYSSSMIESMRLRGTIRGKKTLSNNDWWTATLQTINHQHSLRHRRQQQQEQQEAAVSSRGVTAETAICLDNSDDDDDDKKPVAVTPDENKAASSIDPSSMLMEHDDEDEMQELQASAENEAIPTSKAAFQKHPLYVLPSLLGVAEVLAPDANKRMCGVFKGELVLRRSDVSKARPARKWPYHGRKVKPNQKPIKRIKARKKAASSNFRPLQSYGVGATNDGSDERRNQDIAEASQALEDGMESLYAHWQTEPFSPPPVGPNDAIPVNEYKNVELELLNPGLVHIDVRGASKVAKQLSIPYAPCLLGFEGHGGNRTPTIRGIVIHQHNEEIIREAMREVTHFEIASEQENRRKAVMKKWKKLMVGLLTKDRIEREYGD